MKREPALGFLLAIAVATASTFGMASAAAEKIGLAAYTAKYLDAATDLKQARKKAADADKALALAKEQGQPSLTIEKLAIDAETARLASAEARNQATIAAATRYLALFKSRRDLLAARQEAQIKAAEEGMTKAKFEAGLATQLDVLRAASARLTAEDAALSAEVQYGQARISVARGAGLPDDAALELAEIDLSGLAAAEYDPAACLAAARQAGSSWYSAHKLLDYNRRRLASLQNIPQATQAEKDQAADDLDSSMDQCLAAERALADNVADLCNQYQTCLRKLAIAVEQANLAQQEYDISKAGLDRGETLQTELDQAALQNQQAQNQVALARENLFLAQLRLIAVMGGDVPAVLAKF